MKKIKIKDMIYNEYSEKMICISDKNKHFMFNIKPDDYELLKKEFNNSESLVIEIEK